MNRVAGRVRLEAYALWRVFHFHEGNNDMQKFMIFVLLITWSVITIGIAFEEAEITAAYSMLTALIWATIGRLWGGEIKDITAE